MESLNESQPITPVPVTEPGPYIPPARSRVERYAWVVLLAILVLGAGLRYRGLAWDDDQHLHPDERFLTMVETALKIPSSPWEYFDTAHSPLNPYNNNFSLFIYGTAPLFFVRVVAEVFRQTAYGQVYLIGRGLSALSDLVVVLMVYALGRRLLGLRAGLLAAFLYAVAVFPIQISHYFTVDTFTNVPLVLAFWFTLDIAEGRRGWLAYVLTGVFFGLMLASRINLALYAGIIGLAALFRIWHDLSPAPRGVTLPADQATGSRFDVSRFLARKRTAAAALASETRTLHLGPLHFELDLEPLESFQPGDSAVATDAPTGEHLIWSVQQAVFGLVVLVVATFVAFRVAQPYAFMGMFTLNPQFLDNLATIGRQVSGQDDIPPGHQWAFRIPYWFSWSNLVLWGMGPALGLAASAGVVLAALRVLRGRRWEYALMLAWLVATFLYYGGQFVMTMRYLQPLYPFLAIFAAFFLFALWESARSLASRLSPARLSMLRILAGGLFIVVIGYTLFWALAFTSIYTRTNTRVAASRWILANIPDTAMLASEHWDDALPLRVDGMDYYAKHQGILLTLYDEDTPDKRTRMIEWMDEADYIILSSNRLTDSILRLPMRYPLTVRYYDWLFNGQLGFEKLAEFTSYPQLWGITINDDSSEEQFTVYDHPKVMIYKKTGAYSHDHTVNLFASVDLSEVLKIRPIDATASRNQFRIEAADRAANEKGGTWVSLFNPNDLANRLPVPVWVLTVWVIGLLAFPFTFVLFRAFSDRGYAFAKALGILLAAWVPWTLSSYHVLPLDRPSILLGLVVLFGVGVWIVRRNSAEIRTYLRSNARLLLAEEAIFFAFFALDLVIRYGNPDLWHPSFGGEKPMDFAYLNAIVKTTWLPPYNPWFAGDYINYYYFAQFISAMLIRLSGILPEVAYNLLLPTFFALTASAAFGVALNLVASAHRRAGGRDEASAPQVFAWRAPVTAGLFAVAFVLIIGNLGEVGVLAKGLTDLGGGDLLRGLWDSLMSGQPIPLPVGDWYWTATRVIPNTINEFPFFSFLYGDLHAHVMALPYTLLTLALATHILLNRAEVEWYDLGLLALLLGTLRAANTWDYPTYLSIGGVALVLHLGKQWHTIARDELDWRAWLPQWLSFFFLVFAQVGIVWVPFSMLGLPVMLDLSIYLLLLFTGIAFSIRFVGLRFDPYRIARVLGWRVLAVVALSHLLFLPYGLSEATAYSSVEWWRQDQTSPLEYFTVHGFFLFLIATFLAGVLLRRYRDGTSGSPSALPEWLAQWGPLVGVLLVGLVLFHQWLLLIVLPLVAVGAWMGFHRDTSPEMRWIAILMTAGLLLTLMVEVVVLKGDVGRMNTVFKFYLQAWVLFGVAGATGLVLLLSPLGFPISAPEQSAQAQVGSLPSLGRFVPAGRQGQVLNWAWWVFFDLLLLAGLLYPLFAAPAKVSDRFVPDSPSGLDGMAFMQAATFGENNITFPLRADYDAILWMRQNIQGSPVIAEANTGLYRWGNRFSIYTGLPAIVGWDWHTKQQYSLLPGDIVDQRVQAVRDLYNSPDPNVALGILRRYGVSYVIVGPLEHAVYDPLGLDKFQAMSRFGALAQVYSAGGVDIFQVPARAPALTRR